MENKPETKRISLKDEYPDYATSKRKLTLINSFQPEDCDKLIQELLEFGKASQENIFLFINSGGGSHPGAMRIYDYIRISPAPVIGITMKAYSAASLILQGCHKRFGTPNSRFLFHEPMNSITIEVLESSADKIKIALDKEIKSIKKDTAIAYQIIMKATGRSKEEVEKHSLAGTMFSAEEALKFGLIEAIIEE